MKPAHTPVLLQQSLAVLAPALGESVLDVTAGLGGHASAFAARVGSTGAITIIDADGANLLLAKQAVSTHAPTVAIHSNFAALPDCLPMEVRMFDIIFADLGLSSPHLDTAARGFSFHESSSPLDMRFHASSGKSAADILQDSSERSLQDIFQRYGELPSSARLAHLIAKRRSQKPFVTVADLRALAEEVYGYKAKGMLPQLFQALRIAVNGELHALEHLLSLIPSLLAPHGRVGVLTYHSLEDRLVKRAFKELCAARKDPVTGAVSIAAPFTDLCKGGITPTDEEILSNPRSRSARLRAIQRAV
jgi:16S rRNA (cytosine1402-N4)-methyltransferase